jgi:outer membrane biosynthesis protein TonB
MRNLFTLFFVILFIGTVSAGVFGQIENAASAKCSLRLKIKDDVTEKALTGATGTATDKTSGESIEAVAKEDELFFDGLTQSGTYEISFSRKDYKRTLVESYAPNCNGKAGGVIEINAYMRKGSEKNIYLAGASVKLPDRGVINGSATYLAVPGFPSIARNAGVWGNVSVQVVIDEAGNVTSAFATSGDLLLKQASVKAALASKFKPTLMDGKAIKVSGIIVYSFGPPRSGVKLPI